ncbi:MAG TPA: phosphatase PAP2 family protein [Candidatus Rifleibacterium sp.]|nr:phosphatase PAP2 family protein [Candidatus Rifleibacterium sp.]HPT47146.1 phosphatase PAP2 family protein [Candidatus Rifleibacterium sp.]
MAGNSIDSANEQTDQPVASSLLRRVLSRLKPEEAVYLIFFLILAVISLTEGESHIHLAQDRLGYTFLAIGAGIITFRVNRLLYCSHGIPFNELAEEGRRSLRMLRDIFSVLMCWAMYASLKSILPELPLLDDWLIRADRLIFGFDPVIALESYIKPWLTHFMVVNYALLFAYIPAVFLLLTAKERRRGLRDFLLGLILASFFGYLGYLAVPAIGPQYTQADQFKVALWQKETRLAEDILLLIDLNRVKRDCFPSMHVCLASICLLYAWRYSRKLFWLLLPATLCLIFSTVYLRYHYVIDVFAGLALAMAVFLSTPKLLNWWESHIGPLESA